MARSAGPGGKGGDEGGRLGRWPEAYPAPAVRFRRRPASWLLIALIRLYQRSLSRLWPDVCIYWPSCSNYMIHAVTRRGLLAGTALGCWRILRCHPFARGGYDPPPGYEDAAREYERLKEAQQREARPGGESGPHSRSSADGVAAPGAVSEKDTDT